MSLIMHLIRRKSNSTQRLVIAHDLRARASAPAAERAPSAKAAPAAGGKQQLNRAGGKAAGKVRPAQPMQAKEALLSLIQQHVSSMSAAPLSDKALHQRSAASCTLHLIYQLECTIACYVAPARPGRPFVSAQAAAEPALLSAAVKAEEAEPASAAGPSEDAHAVGLLDRLAGAVQRVLLHGAG